MATDYEALLRLFLRSKQDPKIASTIEQLGNMFDGEDGQKLAQLMTNGGTDVIKAASEAMLRGDKATAKAAMSKLLTTREGAALMTKLADLVSRNG